jgi:SAM-dependent methyltransferase
MLIIQWKKLGKITASLWLFRKDALKLNYTKYILNAPDYNFAVGGKDEARIAMEQLAILKTVFLKSDDKILEVGSGTGRILLALPNILDVNSNYTGIDIVDKCVELTNKRIIELKLDQTRFHAEKMIHATDFPKSHFTFIFGFSVFTHMESEDIFQSLLNLRSVCSENTQLLFTFLPIEHAFGRLLFEAESKIELKNRHKRVRNVAISFETAKSIAKNAGFETINSHWKELKQPFENGNLITNQSWLLLKPKV